MSEQLAPPSASPPSATEQPGRFPSAGPPSPPASAPPLAGPPTATPPPPSPAPVPTPASWPENGPRLAAPGRAPLPRGRHLAPRSRGLAVALVLALVAVAVAAWSLQRTDHALRRADRLAAELRTAEDDAATLAERVAALEAQRRPDPAEIAEQARASVFTIVSATGRGSAWVVGTEDGRSRLVTNFHVVGPGSGPGTRVQVIREEQRLDGEVVMVDERRDLAVVVVAHELIPLPIADVEPRVGDPVMVIGSPLGLEQSVVTGIVSAFRPSHLQISAPLNPGNSGGPVIDARGDVLGVAVLKVGDEATEAIGLAIPVAEVCAVTAC